jgi:hypothetical protein
MAEKVRAVIETSMGDYNYVLEKKSDGTFRCIQKLIDGSQTDELDDWSQLPPEVRKIFVQAQHAAT